MKCKSWAEIGLIGWFAFSLRFDFPVLCGAPKDEYLIKPDLTLFAANYNWQWFPDSQRCHLPIKFLLLVSANTFDWWMEVELAFEIAKKVKSFFAIREIRGDTSMCLPCSPCLFMCGAAGNPAGKRWELTSKAGILPKMQFSHLEACQASAAGGRPWRGGRASWAAWRGARRVLGASPGGPGSQQSDLKLTIW